MWSTWGYGYVLAVGSDGVTRYAYLNGARAQASAVDLLGP
jgi:hypothetical protein